MKNESKGNITFTNSKGETLNLVEILNRKITSMTFNHPSKEITITEEKHIKLFFTEGVQSTKSRFWEKRDLGELLDENPGFGFTKTVENVLTDPAQISFHLGNLKKIEWE